MIGSLMSRMEDAQKLSIQQLQKSIQDGVLPAYIGIPLLQDKIKQAQSAQSPQQPQQPPIAQQVLAQAKQIESGMIPQQQPQQPPQQPQMAPPQQMPQGIDSAESNLPTEMASGGIIGFAEGGVPIELHGTANVSGQGGNAFGGQQGGFGGYGGGYKGYGAGVQERVGAGGSNMFEKPVGPRGMPLPQIGQSLNSMSDVLKGSPNPDQSGLVSEVGRPDYKLDSEVYKKQIGQQEFPQPQIIGQPIQNLLGRNGLPETGIPQQYDFSNGRTYGAPPVAQPLQQDIIGRQQIGTPPQDYILDGSRQYGAPPVQRGLGGKGMAGEPQIAPMNNMGDGRDVSLMNPMYDPTNSTLMDRLGGLMDYGMVNRDPQYAKGGIVGYARGSIIDDEDDDIDPTEDFRTASRMFARNPMEQRRESASMLGMSDSIRPMLSSFTQPISDFASGIKSKFINKTPEVDTVTKPQGQTEGGIPGIIASKAQKYNLPPQLMSSIAKAESNFNPNAGNKTGSSAKGLYQFIDKTWMGMGGKPGEQFDPEMNSELGARYIRQNAEFLKNRLGRDPSYSEVYAAHYFGPSGASNLLTRANPKDSIEKGLGTFNDPKGVKLIMKQNPNLQGKTVGQVLNDLERKTGSGIVSLAQGGQIKHFQVGGGTDYSEGYSKINWQDKEKENKEGKKIKIPGSKIPYQFNPSQLNVGANRTPFAFTPNTPSLGIPSALPSNPSTTTPFVNPSLASMKSANPVVQSAPTVTNQNPSVAMYNIKDANAKPNARPTIRGMNAGSGDTNTFPGGSDINTYLELQEVMKKNPNDENLKSGLDDLLRRNPNLPKEAAGAEKRYAEYKKANPNSMVDRFASFLGIGGGFPNNNQSTALNTDIANQAGVSIKKPVETTSNASNKPTPLPANVQNVVDKFTGPAPVADASYLGDDTNTEIGGLMAPFTPKTDEKEITTKEEEKKPYDFADYLAEMQAKRGEIKGKKDEDKYMSLLAAGLGMMSGTSQYAGANIGKGALAGVQDYRDTQKQRAAELAAVDKEIGSGLYRKTVGDYYTANALSKDEKAKLGQAALLEKTQQNALNTIANIEKDLMARALASVKDSIAYTTGSEEKQRSLLNASYSTLRQRLTPYITNLQKKAGLEMPDMDAMLKEPLNYDDIKKPKK